jgi:hypothetical protein
MNFFCFMYRVLCFTAPLLLTSCSKEHLAVQTDFLNHKSLASYYVGTPDPLVNRPFIGERLIIRWSLPQNYQTYSDLQLKLTVRFGDRTETVQTYRIKKLCGLQVYELFGDDYIAKKGIFTYKAEIIGNQTVLDCWRQHMWVELIQVDKEQHGDREE